MSARANDLPALTAIRGFAAWYVVLFHIRDSIDWLPAPLHRLLGYGYLAVDLFFVLSGFVLWLSYAGRLSAGGREAILPFLWRRIARIWPLHLFLLAALAVLATLFAATGRGDPGRYPFAELPLHALLLQNWGFTDTLGWNVPAWSISTEWAAYLLFPLLAAIGWQRRPFALSLAVAAGLLALLAWAYAPGGRLYIDVPRLGLLRCLAEFTLGTLLCAAWRRPAAAPGIAAIVLLLAAPLLWLAGLPESIAAPLFCAGLVLLLATRPGLLGARWAVWLGEVSYATYLSHTLVWIGFKLLFVADPAHVGPLHIAAYLALALLASALLHRLVERPAQRWLNARPPLSPRPAAAA